VARSLTTAARLTAENRSLRCGEVLDRGSQTDRGEPVVA